MPAPTIPPRFDDPRSQLTVAPAAVVLLCPLCGVCRLWGCGCERSSVWLTTSAGRSSVWPACSAGQRTGLGRHLLRESVGSAWSNPSSAAPCPLCGPPPPQTNGAGVGAWSSVTRRERGQTVTGAGVARALALLQTACCATRAVGRCRAAGGGSCISIQSTGSSRGGSSAHMKPPASPIPPTLIGDFKLTPSLIRYVSFLYLFLPINLSHLFYLSNASRTLLDQFLSSSPHVWKIRFRAAQRFNLSPSHSSSLVLPVPRQFGPISFRARWRLTASKLTGGGLT